MTKRLGLRKAAEQWIPIARKCCLLEHRNPDMADGDFAVLALEKNYPFVSSNEDTTFYDGVNKPNRADKVFWREFKVAWNRQQYILNLNERIALSGPRG